MSFRGQLCDDCARGTLPADAVLVHACELFRFLPENNKLSFSLVVIIIITFANNTTISFEGVVVVVVRGVDDRLARLDRVGFLFPIAGLVPGPCESLLG
jgi:hypothetical protein